MKKIIASFLILSVAFFIVSCKKDDTKVAAPVISSFTPSSGPTGTVVTISGSNFSGATVKFNGVAAVMGAITSNSITCTVPAGATTGTLSVKTGSGTATSATTFVVNTPVGLPPAITSFTPANAIVGGTVTITGTNLTGATVSFNGTVATITSNNGTTIVLTVPIGATSGNIVVTTPGGSVTSVTAFTVTPPVGIPPTITSFTPASGAVGTTLTITGTNLTGGTVKFNNVTATTTSVTATAITCTVPTGATTGNITVTTGGGTATSATSFTVTTISASTFLYVIGDYVGWDFTKAKTINQLTGQPGKYEGFVNMAAGTPPSLYFKYTKSPDWDHQNYANGATNGDLVPYVNPQPSDPAAMSVQDGFGFYYLTADLNTNKWTATKTVWGIIGDASGSWDNSTPMTYDATTGLWKLTTNLVVGSLKFRANNEWKIDFGLDKVTHQLRFTNNPFVYDPPSNYLEGDNIPVDVAGNYTITLDLRVSGDYKYSIVKN